MKPRNLQDLCAIGAGQTWLLVNQKSRHILKVTATGNHVIATDLKQPTLRSSSKQSARIAVWNVCLLPSLTEKAIKASWLYVTAILYPAEGQFILFDVH